MAKKLSNFSFRGVPLANAIAKVTTFRVVLTNGLPYLVCTVGVYSDVAAAEADPMTPVTSMEFTFRDEDDQHLFSDHFLTATPVGANPFEVCRTALYGALDVHPDARNLLAGAIDV